MGASFPTMYTEPITKSESEIASLIDSGEDTRYSILSIPISSLSRFSFPTDKSRTFTREPTDKAFFAASFPATPAPMIVTILGSISPTLPNKVPIPL